MLVPVLSCSLTGTDQVVIYRNDVFPATSSTSLPFLLSSFSSLLYLLYMINWLFVCHVSPDFLGA